METVVAETVVAEEATAEAGRNATSATVLDTLHGNVRKPKIAATDVTGLATSLKTATSQLTNRPVTIATRLVT